MTLENNIRRSIIKTALLHLLKNKSRSPERTARNIIELFCRFYADVSSCPFSYEEVLQILTSTPEKDSLEWIMSHVH